MKILAVVLCLVAMSAADIPSYAGIAEVVDSFESPLPVPRFGLAFDTDTGTLWGIENSSARPNIDLSGNLIQGFVGEGDFNSIGIAVDPIGQHIYYWQNLNRHLQQAHYPDGTFLGTTQLPFGYQNAVQSITYDPILNRVVLANEGLVDPNLGINIRPGFDFVIPGEGIDFSIELDLQKVAGLQPILGLALTEDSYWLLGSAHTRDQIVQIDRATGHLVDRFILPNSHGQTYTGLALDPSTGLFYTNFSNEVIRVIKLTPADVVNDLVTFEPLSSTYAFKPQPSGCPAGFVGIFSFQARLSNISEQPLSELFAEVATITNGNLLQNADNGPGDTGAVLSAPHKDDLIDGVLSPGEFVNVPFQICLRQRKSFRFMVDVLSAAD